MSPQTPDPEPRTPLKVYLAAPLFTQTERTFNRALAALLEEELAGAEVRLPQDFKVSGSFNEKRNFRHLFRRCLESIDTADVVVAILDGADADSGTAFEVGYAYARRVPVVAVRTDYRAGQERGVNMMLSQAAGRFVFDMAFREDPRALAREIAGKVRAVLGGKKK